MMYKALDLLVKVAEARVPQMTAIALGFTGAVTGILFLIRPERFSTTPATASAVDFAPALLWGVLFLGAGLCLINTAMINQSRVFWYCFTLGTMFLWFTAFSGVALFKGDGIGLIVLYTFALGFVCYLTAVAAVAPWLRAYQEVRRDESIRAEKS